MEISWEVGLNISSEAKYFNVGGICRYIFMETFRVDGIPYESSTEETRKNILKQHKYKIPENKHFDQKIKKCIFIY